MYYGYWREGGFSIGLEGRYVGEHFVDAFCDVYILAWREDGTESLTEREN